MSPSLTSTDSSLQARCALARRFAAAALTAGAEILRIRAATPQARLKADNSPVTAADEAAETIILGALESICPDIPVVAEEAAAAGRIPPAAKAFVLVDPLDGTREFIAGRDEFTVNIALVAERTPVAGVIYAPALARLWGGAIAAGEGGAAWTCAVDSPRYSPLCGPETSIRTRSFVPANAVALTSLSHPDAQTAAFIAANQVPYVEKSGSSIKFCRIAEGLADIYPRLGPIMQWDIAAGDAILRAAGGVVACLDGQPVAYGGPPFASPHFVAAGDPEAVAGLLAAAAGVTPS